MYCYQLKIDCTQLGGRSVTFDPELVTLYQDCSSYSDPTKTWLLVSVACCCEGKHKNVLMKEVIRIQNDLAEVLNSDQSDQTYKRILNLKPLKRHLYFAADDNKKFCRFFKNNK